MSNANSIDFFLFCISQTGPIIPEIEQLRTSSLPCPCRASAASAELPPLPSLPSQKLVDGAKRFLTQREAEAKTLAEAREERKKADRRPDYR